jgi:predicted nucleic acid-binding protein
MLRGEADAGLTAEVESLLRRGASAWCPMVELELWAGVRDVRERRQLTALAGVLHALEIGSEVWQRAVDLAGRARSKGTTVPPSDLLIFACKKVHGVQLLHRDSHFDMLERAARA